MREPVKPTAPTTNDDRCDDTDDSSGSHCNKCKDSTTCLECKHAKFLLDGKCVRSCPQQCGQEKGCSTWVWGYYGSGSQAVGRICKAMGDGNSPCPGYSGMRSWWGVQDNQIKDRTWSHGRFHYGQWRPCTQQEFNAPENYNRCYNRNCFKENGACLNARSCKLWPTVNGDTGVRSHCAEDPSVVCTRCCSLVPGYRGLAGKIVR